MSLVHSHEETVPRPMLAMAMALVGISLALTAAVRLGFAEREAVPGEARALAAVTALETRQLRFLDAPDGAVVIREAGGRTIARLEGEQPGAGFIRGVMRGLARERRMRGLGSAPPFILTRWSDGALSLTDSATGRSVELGAFGPDNRAAFARLLAGGQP